MYGVTQYTESTYFSYVYSNREIPKIVEPETPEEPETPQEPETPKEPENPEDPEKPGNSDN